MATTLDRTAIRPGRVRARYFRENFAQGGLDLAQVLPELVTNADAAIASSGRSSGRIELRFGTADPEFRSAWRRELRRLRVPAVAEWAHQVSCTDDGEGVDGDHVDRRLGALGVAPGRSGQRGLFGRGLRDVWLAHGGGRIQGVRGERAVESWFFASLGDEPYAFAHVLDGPVTPDVRRSLEIAHDGTRVSVPLDVKRLPPNGRLRTLVTQLVQLRPVLEDAGRQLLLELPGEPVQLVTHLPLEPDPDRSVLFDDVVRVQGGVGARVVVRRAATPIPLGASRATRRGGLLIRSGRAAHEVTLVGLEGRQGARHLYGDVWCDAIEELQRDALDSPRPQVVVKVDRSGLNESHPLVQRLYAALERVLRPIVEAEERRAGAHVVTAGRAIRARDEVGLRALNDALRNAFDAPGSAGFTKGGEPSREPPVHEAEETIAQPAAEARAGRPAAETGAAMRFKQSPIRLHPGEQRSVSLLFDPERVPSGTSIEVIADQGLALRLRQDTVPEPGRAGWSRVSGTLRARVSVEPGSHLFALAQAGEHSAELAAVIVRHRASGWVREIARKDEDAQIEASFDPHTGVVTVFEGRREFKALAKAARRSGLSRRRVPEYLPHRLLEVEVAANAVYAWAAERILERRAAEERPADPAEYATLVRIEMQALRYRVHERLMRAFLEPEVFEGGVILRQVGADIAQRSLLDET